MSKNIPVKNRVAKRLDQIKEIVGIYNYSNIIEMLLNKTYPQTVELIEDEEEKD